MAELSQDQLEKRAKIQKGAMTWAVIAGGIVALLLLWILSGQGAALRFGGALVAGMAVGYFVHKASFNARAKEAKCGKCGAAFSRSRTDRQETLTGSEAKEEREEQEDKSVKVTTWTEETFDVFETYTCAKCGDATTEESRITRRRDEETVTEPAPVPEGWTRSEPAPEAATETATETAAERVADVEAAKPEPAKSGSRSRSRRG